MASLRDTRKRIKSVKNTQKITKAMKMVSAAKLRRAQEAVEAARPYAEKMNMAVASIAKRAELAGEIPHPLLAKAREGGPVEVLVLTSDRGLCGGFNSNTVRKADAFHYDNKGTNSEIRFSTIGKKGDQLLRLKHDVREHHEDVIANPTFAQARKIAQDYCNSFVDDDLEGLFFLYNRFKGGLQLKQVLPVATVETQAHLVDFRYEPSPKELLNKMLPEVFATQLYLAMLESSAADHLARMMAMDNATKNAGEMVDRLTLQYNRARQAAITTELLEIIAGAEAIK